MRSGILAAIAAAALFACSGESTSSNSAATGDLITDADGSVLAAFGAGAWLGGVGADGIGGFGHLGWRLNELPDSLALTTTQESRIAELVDAFKADHQDDLDALAAIRERAEAARNAGASADSVHTILAGGDEIRDRLRSAEEALVGQIENILTDAQRAYLETRTCGECDSTVAPLTDEQKASIDSLVAAFEADHADDIAAVRAAEEAAHAAHESGVSHDSLDAIWATLQPALERLRSARSDLQARINALLTPEQAASGCYLQRGEPRGHGGHGPHGGGPDGDGDGGPDGDGPQTD